MLWLALLQVHHEDAEPLSGLHAASPQRKRHESAIIAYNRFASLVAFVFSEERQAFTPPAAVEREFPGVDQWPMIPLMIRPFDERVFSIRENTFDLFVSIRAIRSIDQLAIGQVKQEGFAVCAVVDLVPRHGQLIVVWWYKVLGFDPAMRTHRLRKIVSRENKLAVNQRRATVLVGNLANRYLILLAVRPSNL